MVYRCSPPSNFISGFNFKLITAIFLVLKFIYDSHEESYVSNAILNFNFYRLTRFEVIVPRSPLYFFFISADVQLGYVVVEIRFQFNCLKNSRYNQLFDSESMFKKSPEAIFGNWKHQCTWNGTECISGEVRIPSLFYIFGVFGVKWNCPAFKNWMQ